MLNLIVGLRFITIQLPYLTFYQLMIFFNFLWREFFYFNFSFRQKLGFPPFEKLDGPIKISIPQEGETPILCISSMQAQ